MIQEQTSTSARAVSDTAKLFGARLAAGAISVFFTAWLIRLLPVEELALWPIILALAGIIEALGSLGMGDTFVRRIPRHLVNGDGDAASRLLKTGLVLNVLVCAAVTVLLYSQATWAAEHLLGGAEKASLVSSVALAAFLLALEKRLGWGLNATQQFGRIAALSLVTNTLRTPVAVVLYLRTGLTGLLLAFAVVPALGCVLTVVWLWPHLWRSRTFEPVGGLLAFALPYYGVSITGFIRGRAHYLLVGLLTTPEVLGVYFVACRVSDYIRELNRFGISAVTPKLAERGGSDPQARPRLLRKCTRYILLGLLPMHLGVAVLARPIVGLYAGAEYLQAGTLLTVLALFAYLELLYSVHRAYIQVFAPPVHLLVLQIVSALVDLGTMTALVILYGGLGAALAKFATYALLALMSALLLRRTMELQYDIDALKTALIAGAVLIGACLLVMITLGDGAIAVGLGVAIGAVAYVVSLTGRLQMQDIEVVYEALPERISRCGIGVRMRDLLQRWFAPGPADEALSATGETLS